MEQERELLRLHSLHGSKWAMVGRALGVSGAAAREKYRLIKQHAKGLSLHVIVSQCLQHFPPITGKWTKEEERRLVKAIQDLQEQWRERGTEVIDREDLPPTATWENVADRVVTRNAYQCRSTCDYLQILPTFHSRL